MLLGVDPPHDGLEVAVLAHELKGGLGADARGPVAVVAAAEDAPGGGSQGSENG